LNLVVVAEGVENEAQLRFVQASGSDQYQGFLRSEPLPAVDFGRLLALAA
jgi:EAL domain-containing protein (putative c-di-GMP-specific phosphodiesterase class I)